MCAPTRGTRRCRVPGSPRGSPRPVGRAFTPAAPRQFQNRNVRPAAGPGGMRTSRPTNARVVAAVPVWPEAQNLFVGAGFIPPAGVRPVAGFPGRTMCAPTRGTRRGSVCGWPRGFPSARRGGFHIRPHASPRRKASGTMQASSPTEVCCNAGPRFSGSPRGLPRPVGRAFTPAAPRRFQNRNVRPAAGPGGMRASRPTNARAVAAVLFGRSFSVVCRGGPPQALCRSGSARNTKFIRRGGIYPARGCSPHRGLPGPI